MREVDELFARLAESSFRRRFALRPPDERYLQQKGMPTILEHAEKFIRERLAPAQPRNDGKQTPYRGHPVFVAQHATATCCRGCLQKWHGIPRGREMTEPEMQHVVAVLQRWITMAAENAAQRA